MAFVLQMSFSQVVLQDVLYLRQYSRQTSRISVTSNSRRAGRTHPVQRIEKDSVLKIAYDGVRSLVVGSLFYIYVWLVFSYFVFRSVG